MKLTRFGIGLLFAFLCVIGILGAASCTANQRAKNFGGSQTVELSPGVKLVTATWKDAELWYLTRPMRVGETPETLTLHEQSSFGMVEGTVTFVERASGK